TAFIASAACAPPLDIKKPQRTKRNIRRIEESFTTKDTKTTKKHHSGSQESRKGISEIDALTQNSRALASSAFTGLQFTAHFYSRRSTSSCPLELRNTSRPPFAA